MKAEGCNPHIKDYQNKTLLHIAAQVGSLEIVQILVEAKLNPDAINNHGLSPLDTARLFSHSNVEWWLKKLSRPSPAVELSPQLLIVSLRQN